MRIKRLKAIKMKFFNIALLLAASTQAIRLWEDEAATEEAATE